MPTWTKEQSDAIYKSGTNIIVSAGAGSGKTAVLTARVLQKLEEGIHVNELLILTFTKAAAGEMKERIRKKIKEKPNLKKELALLDTSYVTTFDSFSLSVVKKYHYLLNISSNPEITDATILEILKKDTMRTILDSYYQKNEKNFTSFIQEYCVKDDEEIYSSLLNIANKLEKNFTKEEILSNQEQTYDAKFANYLNDFEALLKTKRQALQEKLEELSRIAPKEYMEKCYENLSGILHAKNLDELVSYKSSKFPTLPRNLEEEIKRVKNETNETLKELIQLLEYGDSKTLQKDYNSMKPIVLLFSKILNEYFKELETRKQEHGYYDFNDIAFIALKLLKENETVREEIKQSFKEIMIDEYQDTNDIQEEFIRLISDHNVYMVGDIKQSIYRFRNANPYLFKKKYDQYRIHEDGEKIDLLKNFRSRKEVLQNINQIFNLIMDDTLGGANYIEEHQMNFGNMAYIEKGTTKENYHMELLTYTHQKDLGYTKEEIEIFAIGRDIQKKIQGGYLLYDKDSGEIHPVSYKDFVILMDRSTNFNLYKKIFNDLKIPISIYKDETIQNSTCFYVIKNLLKLIISYQEKTFNQEFEYALTSIARSFLFEYTDASIYQLLKERNWYQNSIYETIKPIIQGASSKTLSEIIASIYKQTNIYQKIIKISNIEENMAILTHFQTLAEQVGKNAKNIQDFCEFLNRITKEEMAIQLSANEQIENSVKIMTIHKSKGLEYPICYFSGLYKPFNITDTKERFLYDEHYGFIAPLKEEGIYSIFLKELMKQNYIQEEISEKIRLFYVAVTRAKEKMIFVLPNCEKIKKEIHYQDRLQNRSLADFLYNIWDYLKEYRYELKLEELRMNKNYLYETKENQLVPNNQEILHIEEIEWKSNIKEQQKFSKNNFHFNTKEDYQNIELGLKIHEYLEQIDFQNPNFHLIPNSFLRSKVKKFLDSDLIQDKKNINFYKEYEFITTKDNQEYHGIIDLIIEQKDQIIIVDYKLNNVIDEAYCNQLKGYQEYIEQKTKKPTSTYLYSILQENVLLVSDKKAMVQ